MSTTKILGLSGSLRRSSLNSALVRAAAAHAPDGVSVELYDYGAVPLYDDDLPADDPGRAAVEALKAAIAAADGVLLAVPEYNYSLPGVLKNAIDWASRPAYHSPFRDKPVGVVSASMSFVGGARGQQHTKNVLMGMAAAVFPWPEFLVPSAHQKFKDGRLVDDTTRGFLEQYMAGFSAWIEKVRG